MSEIIPNKILAMNPFKGAGSLVLRKLLTTPEREWTGIELARELDLSNPWCNKVLNALESEKIVERGGRGLAAFTRLIDPQELLSQWLTIYRWGKNTFHGFITKEKGALQRLSEACEKEGWLYAATGRSALPARHRKALGGPETVYVSPRKPGYRPYAEMLKALQTKYGFYKVIGNADIQVINPALGRAVYFERMRRDSIYVVSPLQLYLDLKGMAAGEGMPQQFFKSLLNLT
jgi:hypothetical protein